MTSQFDPGERLANGELVHSAEQGLTRKVKALMVELHQGRLGTHKMTRFEMAVMQGRVLAYLDAILAIRAGSDRYPDTSSALNGELFAQLKDEGLV